MMVLKYINTSHALGKYSQMILMAGNHKAPQMILMAGNHKALRKIFFRIAPNINPPNSPTTSAGSITGWPFSRLQRLDNNSCTNLQLRVGLSHKDLDLT